VADKSALERSSSIVSSATAVHPEPPIETISSSSSSHPSFAPALPSRSPALINSQVNPSNALSSTVGSYSPNSRYGSYGGYGGGYGSGYGGIGSGIGSSYGNYGGLGSYSRFGSNYGNTYSGYGNQYGNGMMGINPDDPNSLRHTIEAGSQRTSPSTPEN
jgi:peroxin-13